MRIKHAKHQTGLSLIELMIAVALSIFVVGAMISLFVNSKENYRMNENLSRLQENARFAVSFLARDLRMADYRACVSADRLPAGVSGTNNAGLNTSDTVTILFQSNACGSAISTVTTLYTVEAGTSGPALFRTVDGTKQELVEGIQDLQITYGQDTDNDDVPNFFAAADSVGDWAQSVSVRITLIARTLESNLTPDGNPISRSFTSTVTLRNRLP